jgi:hypothetical protein
VNARSGSARPRAGDDPAVLIAGALAESGIARLTLRTPGAPDQTLLAGRTDLPGVLRKALASAGAAELIDPAHGTWVRVSAESINWTSASEELHAALGTIGGQQRRP